MPFGGSFSFVGFVDAYLFDLRGCYGPRDENFVLLSSLDTLAPHHVIFSL